MDIPFISGLGQPGLDNEQSRENRKSDSYRKYQKHEGNQHQDFFLAGTFQHSPLGILSCIQGVGLQNANQGRSAMQSGQDLLDSSR
jgi:hypothetical protein